MPRNVSDMVVVITGASAGIGAALAAELSRRGARLVLAARRLDRLEALNQSLGGRHLCVRADVSLEADCRMLVDRAFEQLGRIDTLVCNAGYGLLRKVHETSRQEIEQIFRTNVFGTSDCIRFAVPRMAQQPERDGWRGQVMIVSSAAARRGIPFYGAYSGTKAAQLGMAEALRVELRARRIAVTSVHPVGTDTEFGTVAEREAGSGLPPPGFAEKRQSAETVAHKMLQAIERPRPEVWPQPGSRFMLGFATLVPGAIDRVMAKYRGHLRHETK